MSMAPTEQTLPRQVDPRKFAQKGVALAGIIQVADLPRIADAVTDVDSVVVVDVVFGTNDEGHKTLSGTAEATLSVTCQRCLEPTALKLDVELSLAIVWDEEHAAKLPKSLDPWITEEGAADLYHIIEEELLLELPMVAYHEEACVDQAAFSSGEEVVEPEPKRNPFQVLEQLMGSPK